MAVPIPRKSRWWVSRLSPAVVLTLAGLLAALLTGLWIGIDHAICPPSDSEHHLFNALLFGRSFQIGGWPVLWETTRLSYVGWPPASYVLLYGPLAALLSDAPQWIRAYGILLIPLLLFGTYRLGSQFLDRRNAALAAVITLFSFGVMGQIRQVSIDLPAAAVVTLALLALYQSRRFERPGPALLLGAALGLGLFTRVQALFYLVGPGLLVFVLALFRAPGWPARLRVFALALLAGAVAVGVSSPWWSGNLRSLWLISTSHLDPTQVNPRGDPTFWEGVVFYGGALGRTGGWPVFLGVLALLPQLVQRRREEALMLLLSVAGGFLGLTLGVHREDRYILPALPSMAILAVMGLGCLRRRIWHHRLGAALLLCIVGPTLVFTGFGISFETLVAEKGFISWAYLRKPQRQNSVDRAMRAMRRELAKHGGDPSGTSLYLLFGQEKDANFIPRLGAYLLPELPAAAFAYSLNINMVNSPWHLGLRHRRQVFLVTEMRKVFHDLPLMWSVEPNTFSNRTPLRIYRVPKNHRFRKRIDFWDFHLDPKSPEPQGPKTK